MFVRAINSPSAQQKYPFLLLEQAVKGIRLKSMKQSITGDIRAIKPSRLSSSGIAAARLN